MKTKAIQFVPITLVLLSIGFVYFSQWCTSSGYICYRTWLDSVFIDVINPLYFFSLYSLPGALIIAFVPRPIFISWLKLVAWALPLALIFIALTPVNWMGIGLDLYPFYRDDAARLTGGIVTAASLMLVVVKYFIMWRTSRSPKMSS